MENQVCLSIIVPVFNAEHYLLETAKSVLKQSFKDYELIFVNDGSTDNSLSILREIESCDKRVKIYSQENKGVTAARKLGWQNSQGSYITFLDADDAFSEDGLSNLVKEMKSGDYDIVNGSFISVPGGRHWIHKVTGELSQMKYLETLLFGNSYGVIYASIYRIGLFEESTFSFDQSFKIGEDVLMNIELCSRINKIKNIDTIVYRYTDDNHYSAMKVIVRHPFYYLRYNQVRDALLKRIDYDYYESIKVRLGLMDDQTIISAFFSPLIDYNEECYLKVKKIGRRIPPRNYSFASVLPNRYLTKIVKESRFAMYVIKGFFMNRPRIKRKIIY